jgi:hypothetical protein
MMSDGHAVSVEFAEYSDADLPALLRWQVLSFLRIVWPEGFTGPSRFRDWTSHPDLAPHHLIYAAGPPTTSYSPVAPAHVAPPS